MSKTSFRTRKAESTSSDKGGATPNSTFATELQDEFRLSGVDDVTYPDVKIFIEGVQVPFESFSVSQPYMGKPTANISIPPATGLTEIPRNYFPKVNIFYRDIALEKYLEIKGKEYSTKDIYRTFFTGVIVRCQYSKSNNAQGARSSIEFNCIDKDYVIEEILVKYGGRGAEEGNNTGPEATAVSTFFNSHQAALQALQGLKRNGVNDGGKTDIDTYISNNASPAGDPQLGKLVDPSILSTFMDNRDKWDDLVGIPSVALVLWQILKMDAYRFPEQYTDAMRGMYIPLMDNGIKYFYRMAGHKSIETLINSDKYPLSDTWDNQAGGRGDLETPIDKIMMPPAYRTFIGKAASTDMAIQAISRLVSSGASSMSFEQLFVELLRTLRYDRLQLNSPIQSINPDRDPIDKIVKPLLPFYYSPTCNVLLPNMYHSISVSEDFRATPTRVRTHNNGVIVGAADSAANIDYKAPHWVRDAYARGRAVTNVNAQRAIQDQNPEVNIPPSRNPGNKDLSGSLSHKGEVVALHETGQGIRSKVLGMTSWVNQLNIVAQYEAEHIRGVTGGEALSADERDDLDRLIGSWQDKYPKALQSMNPWQYSDINGISAYQRNIINTLEYDYSLSVVETKVGRVTCPFNPYIISGYPCDIMDDNPNRPSFHAFVVDVSHSMNAGGSLSTSISLSSVLSYDEMQSYDMPPVFPWLRVKLGLAEKSNILSQPESTKQKASDYYKEVIGVGFADPTYLYDFRHGKARDGVSLNNVYGDLARRELGDNPDSALSNTTEGCMMIVRREIETMADVERPWKGRKNFIIMDGDKEDSPEIGVSQDQGKLDEEELRDVVAFYRKATDVGMSPFLTYEDDN